MVQFLSSLVVLAVISSNFAANAADIDCSKSQKFDGIETCCVNEKQVVTDIGDACETKTNQKGPILNPCFVECLFNSSAIMANGEIQYDKLRGLIAEEYKDAPDFLPTMDTSFTKCEQMVKSKATSINASSGPGNCNQMPLALTKCMMVSTFVNCPKSVWKNDDKCNNAKEYFKSCDVLNAVMSVDSIL